MELKRASETEVHSRNLRVLLPWDGMSGWAGVMSSPAGPMGGPSFSTSQLLQIAATVPSSSAPVLD